MGDAIVIFRQAKGLFTCLQNKCFVTIDTTFCTPQCRTGPSVNSTQPKEQLL